MVDPFKTRPGVVSSPPDSGPVLSRERTFLSLCFGEAPAIGAILSIFVLSFNQVIFFGDTFWREDIAFLTVPLKYALAEAIRTRRFDSLIWSRLVSAGFPLYGEGEGGFLYPPNFISVTAFNPIDANAVLMVLHYTFAGVASYALARYLGIRKMSAIVAGIVYPLGGTFVGALFYPHFTSSAAWLPVLLLVFEWALRRRQLRHGIVVGLIWAIQLLAGHVQVAAFSLVGVGLYAVGRVVEERETGRRLVYPLGLVSVTAVVGAGLAAVQILPTLDIIGQSIRATVSANSAITGSIPPASVASLLYPFVFADPSRGVDWDTLGTDAWIYTGIAPVALALLGLVTPRKRGRLPLIVMTLGALALAFGDYLPVYHLLRFLPGFGGFRFPSRFGLVFDLGIGLLAAHVLDSFSPAAVRRVWTVIVGLACWGAAGTLLVYLGIASGRLLPGLTRQFRDAVLGSAGNPHLPRDVLQDALNGTVDLHHPWVKSPVALLGIVGLALVLVGWRPRSSKAVQTSLVLVTVIDLLFFGSLVWPFARVPRSDVIATPPVISALPEAAQQSRVATSYGLAPADDRLRPDSLMRFSLSTIVGYGSLRLTRAEAYLAVLTKVSGTPRLASLLGAGAEEYAIYSPGTRDYSSVSPFALRPMGSDAPPSPFVEPDFVPLWQGEDGTVYRNSRALPRARVVYSTLDATSIDDAAALLARPEFDPSRQVVIEGLDELRESPDCGRASSVVWLEDDPLQIELQVKTPCPGVLVLADMFYPSWHAWIDGRETRIYPADVMFRGIFLSPGTHRVRLADDTVALRTGAGVSLATLALVAGWIVVSRFNERQRHADRKCMSAQPPP